MALCRLSNNGLYVGGVLCDHEAASVHVTVQQCLTIFHKLGLANVSSIAYLCQSTGHQHTAHSCRTAANFKTGSSLHVHALTCLGSLLQSHRAQLTQSCLLFGSAMQSLMLPSQQY